MAGRPLKNQVIPITVMVTPEMSEAVKAAAGNYGQSEWARQAIAEKLATGMNGYTQEISNDTKARNLSARLMAVFGKEYAAECVRDILVKHGQVTPEFVRDLDKFTRDAEALDAEGRRAKEDEFLTEYGDGRREAKYAKGA